MILKTLISMLRCVWLGLELNSAGVGQIWRCLIYSNTSGNITQPNLKDIKAN